VNGDALSSMLYFVGFGLLFYWMMKKGGCGMHGHGGHGHQHEHSGHGSQSGDGSHGLSIDPVCGMQVDPSRAAGTRTIGATTFFLCSEDCLAKFDRDVARLAQTTIGSR